MYVAGLWAVRSLMPFSDSISSNSFQDSSSSIWLGMFARSLFTSSIKTMKLHHVSMTNNEALTLGTKLETRGKQSI